jgi:predicted O-methyltransferase YrrM
LYLPQSVLTTLAVKIAKRQAELPLLGFRAIKQLDLLIQPDWRVLEFGSGMSTVWFARRCREVVSIEINPDWHKLLQARLARQELRNVDYRLSGYSDAHVLTDCPGSYFDLVLVDGVRRDRAMQTALEKVKPGGYIFLDNSDYSDPEYQTAKKLLLGAAAEVTVFNDLTPSRVWVTEGMLGRMKR